MAPAEDPKVPSVRAILPLAVAFAVLGAGLAPSVNHDHRVDDAVPPPRTASPSNNDALDWTLVLDTSGSMANDARRREVGRRLHALAGSAPAGATFRLVTFDDHARLSWPETSFADAPFDAILDSLQPMGGSNPHAGLQLGVRLAKEAGGGAVVLVTDGAANAGETAPEALRRLMDDAVAHGIAVRTVKLATNHPSNATWIPEVPHGR